MTNIVLISVDDLRLDCLSCFNDISKLEKYGITKDMVYTPTMDFLAEDGQFFPNAYAPASYTPSSHASMLTGVYPNKHKTVTFFSGMTKSYPTLPQMLSSNGYFNIAWVEHPTFETQRITRGFNLVFEPLEGDEDMYIEDVFDNNIVGKNNFFFFHLFDVHKPYYYETGGADRISQNNGSYIPRIKRICDRHDISLFDLSERALEEVNRIGGYNSFPYALQELAYFRAFDFALREKLKEDNSLLEEMVKLYVEGVSLFDCSKLANLIVKLEEYDPEVKIILTSDHGEMEHNGNFCNSPSVSEEAIRIPLITKGFPVSKHPKRLCSLVDIVPTILDAAGVNVPSVLDGYALNTLPYERQIFTDSWALEKIEGGVFTAIANLESSPRNENLVAARTIGHLGDAVYIDGAYIGDEGAFPALKGYLDKYEDKLGWF